MISGLGTEASDDQIAGFKRMALHHHFLIKPDLNMLQQVRVVMVDHDGVPLLEKIRSNPALSELQRADGLARYADKIVDKTTSDCFIDPKTGAVVPADTEGCIPQLVAFQSITLGQMKQMGMKVDDDTPFANLLYSMIANEIANINARGGL